MLTLRLGVMVCFCWSELSNPRSCLGLGFGLTEGGDSYIPTTLYDLACHFSSKLVKNEKSL